MGVGLQNGTYLCNGYMQKIDNPSYILVSIIKTNNIGYYNSLPIPYKLIQQESFINYIRKVKPTNKFYFTVENDVIKFIYTPLK